MIRMTASFKDAVTSTLGEKKITKRPTKLVKKVCAPKHTPVVNETYGAGESGPGGYTIAQSKGYGGSMPPFARANNNDGSDIGNIDMRDIGTVEDQIAKNHSNPIFPLESLPINIMNAGEKISDLIPAIDSALKHNKVLTDVKKEELKKSKDIIKTILGNIRKVASMIDKIQN